MTTNPCPHARSAAEFITSRAVMGRKKYGHTLADAALSPAALVRHAREEAADLLVYLTALEAALSWQPIETAPMDGTEVDLWRGKHRFPNCHFHCGEWLWWNTTSVDDEPSWLKVKDPTHWLPLPPGPEPEPERSGHYECLSDKPSGTWDEAFKPEPTAPEWFREWLDMEDKKEAARKKIEAETATPEPARPVVTREAVTAIITGNSDVCQRASGSCGNAWPCYCRRTIDAIMALIGGAP